MDFFTIGVYNTSEQQFFQKLIDNKIDVFCDIRQRRGVRGSKYSFVNSKRLQNKLFDLRIDYIHEKSLAPTNEIRELQREVDKSNKNLKSSRNKLGNIFIDNYNDKILKNFNFSKFLELLNEKSAQRVCLFCVEEKYQACHRSLVTNVLLNNFKYKITHL